jgi:hypothetical protein
MQAPARLGSSWYWAITELAATRTRPLASRDLLAKSPSSSSSVAPMRWQ